MGNNTWSKDIGTVWFICLFVGVFMGGSGLVMTIPIAIFYTIYAIWKDLRGEKPPSVESHRYWPHGRSIEELDTMDIPESGYSSAERAAEYRRRGESPSGVIDGVYNDTNLPPGVGYNDTNRDWDAGA